MRILAWVLLFAGLASALMLSPPAACPSPCPIGLDILGCLACPYLSGVFFWGVLGITAVFLTLATWQMFKR
jgi:hypothetical protein